MLHPLIWLLSQAPFWELLGIALGPYLFFRGFRLLQLKRRIMGVPRSTIRAAALGPVEISGTVVGPYPIAAPLSRTNCYYYRIKVQSNPRHDLDAKIHELCAPLFLDDGTGTVMIYPGHAELRFPASYKRAEYGKLAMMLLSRSSGDPPEFSEEYSLRAGDKVFVLGTLQANKWRKPHRDADDMSRIGPGFVCPAEADLQRREEGCVLPWKEAERTFDLEPPIILARGEGPFVISTNSQHDLIQKLSWTSLLFIWGAPVWTLWALWELLGDSGLLASLAQVR
jgi:hypothetical protein